MKVFHCANCNKTEIDFTISTKEEVIRQTWLNIRDGYGRAINHLICPYCGYVLSGFINWNNDVDNSSIEYLKETIKMYSSREYEGGFLNEGSIDYICKREIERKNDKYKDLDDKFILNIIKTMSGLNVNMED